MAKLFKDWLDEFVNNGAKPNDITTWPEEAGGGVVVVDELPEVGEENKIYEVRKVLSKNLALVPVDTDYFDGTSNFIVVNNKEEASYINEAYIETRYQQTYISHMPVYVKETDTVIVYMYDSSDYTITKQTVLRNPINHSFLIDDEFVCIVTDYVENITFPDTAIATVTLPDGTQVTINMVETGVGKFVKLVDTNTNLFRDPKYYISYYTEIQSHDDLPTAKEVMDNKLIYLLEGIIKKPYVFFDDTLQTRLACGNKTRGQNYGWDRMRLNFYTRNGLGLTDEIYEGPLEWKFTPIIGEVDSLYSNRPDGQLGGDIYIPQPPTIITTKYVYENNKWVDLDAPEPTGLDADRFALLEDDRVENLYCGEVLPGLKFQIDCDNYYQTVKDFQGQSDNGIIKYDANYDQFENREEDLMVCIKRTSDWIDTFSIVMYLQYDVDGNIWAKLALDVHGNYDELTSSIMVATAEELLDPAFTLPTVEFTIPDDWDPFDIDSALHRNSIVVYTVTDTQEASYVVYGSLVKVSKQ